MKQHHYPQHVLGKLLPALLLFTLATLSYAQTPVSPQSLLLSLQHTGQAVQVLHAILKDEPFNAPAPNTVSTSTHRYVLLSQDNKELYSAAFSDPLEVQADDFSDPGNPKGGKTTLPQAQFILNVPYLPDAKRIRFERQNTTNNAAKAATNKAISLGVAPIVLWNQQK